MTDITHVFAWALVQVLDGAKEHDLADQFGIHEDECAKVMSLLAQARAYLTQSEPKMLTDEEIDESFDRWWRNEGSAMRPGPKEDLEEHSHRLSLIAWQNGAYVARRNK